MRRRRQRGHRAGFVRNRATSPRSAAISRPRNPTMAPSQQPAGGTGQRGDGTRGRLSDLMGSSHRPPRPGNSAQPARPDSLRSREKRQDWRWQVDRGKTAPLAGTDPLRRLTVGSTMGSLDLARQHHDTGGQAAIARRSGRQLARRPGSLAGCRRRPAAACRQYVPLRTSNPYSAAEALRFVQAPAGGLISS